ncbi:hypothetical protein B0T20DRAFT_389247 [Sordaria brevicollis]|uniref:Uncharacterized protein n=1 Tax=Sordaria brevicollis TaxID=83679 RepID=A0AAE0PKL1_SORBR|nr:hypothetical protein B0T20DRAFT_389247 [Sordaria brevicollis]
MLSHVTVPAGFAFELTNSSLNADPASSTASRTMHSYGVSPLATPPATAWSSLPGLYGLTTLNYLYNTFLTGKLFVKGARWNKRVIRRRNLRRGNYFYPYNLILSKGVIKIVTKVGLNRYFYYYNPL